MIGLTTPAYLAPEIIADNASSTKVDMWALGVIFYQFFSNQHPFESSNYNHTLKLIADCEPAPLPWVISPFIKKIIAQLLDKNPEKRPNAQDLINT